MSAPRDWPSNVVPPEHLGTVGVAPAGSITEVPEALIGPSEHRCEYRTRAERAEADLAIAKEALGAIEGFARLRADWRLDRVANLARAALAPLSETPKEPS